MGHLSNELAPGSKDDPQRKAWQTAERNRTLQAPDCFVINTLLADSNLQPIIPNLFSLRR
jgi:hypothetical protein